MKVITDEEPPRPRSVSRALHSDLDAIIMHALEKDPARRYQSVQDLADDLRRYLAGQSVTARGGGMIGRHTRELLKRRALVPVVILGAHAVVLAVSLIVQVADVMQAGAVAAAMHLPAVGLGAAAHSLRRERDVLPTRTNQTGQSLAAGRVR